MTPTFSSPSSPALSTPVRLTETYPLLESGDTVMSCGSCFSEHLAAHLRDGGFSGHSNPNGILYNPYSINEALQHIDVPYGPEDFFEFNGLFHSFGHHGSFSRAVLEDAIHVAEKRRKNFFRLLKRARMFLLTVSSALVYRHVESDRIVANCHKLPNDQFERVLLSHDTCRAAMLCACRKILSVNPDCNILLSLSPVRHYPGDLSLNAVSKARLRSSIHDVCISNKSVLYFPAYEIVTDELRDYRFFDDDMLHPSACAVSIVIHRFLDACVSENGRSALLDALKRKKAAEHRPIHPDSPV